MHKGDYYTLSCHFFRTADMDEGEGDYDIAYAHSENSCTEVHIEEDELNFVHGQDSTKDSNVIKTVQNPYYDNKLELEPIPRNGEEKPTEAHCSENIVVTHNPYYE